MNWVAWSRTMVRAKDWTNIVVTRSRKLLRCVFANPFRPIAIDPRWLTSTVVDVATAIYNERSLRPNAHSWRCLDGRRLRQ